MSQKRDTYGNVMAETTEEWRSFQRRNRDIEAAARNIRAKLSDLVKEVTFYSVGVRCRGSLWTPKKPLEGNPGIVICHGWGGLRAFLDVRYASKFVEDGFHVLTFDYRGWGSSDGKVVPVYDKGMEALQQTGRENDFKEQDATIGTATVRVVRQVVDSDDHLEDLEAAVAFFSSLPNLGRIGLFGSSHAGGYVLEFGARDQKHISCIVSQVPSLGKNGAGNFASLEKEIGEARRKSSLTGWIPRGAHEVHLPEMDGSPIYNTLAFLDPIRSCAAIKAPTLIIDAEYEELWDVKQNGLGAFQAIQAKGKEYHIIKGVKHYDVYLKAAQEARKVATNFFIKHLSSSRL